MKWIPDERISDALIKFNPWWHDPAMIQTMAMPYRRLIVEKAMLMITHPEQRHFAILSGFRYVGKTMCLYQMIKMLLDNKVLATSILYLSFENPIMRYAEIDDIYRIYLKMNPDAKGTRYLFFDDILYRGAWVSWMTSLFCQWEDVRLAATTSASPMENRQKDNANGQVEESANSKPWSILNVQPLSFYEHCRLNGIRLPDETIDGNGIIRLPKDDAGHATVAYHHLSHLQNALIRYLKRGGLPRFASLDKEDYEEARFGPNIMSYLIGYDILSFFKIRHPQLCEQLMLYLACKPSPIFVAQQAAKDLGNISVTTLEQYINILESANLIFRSYPIDIGRKGASKGHPKIYIADPAIRNALLAQEPEHDEHENEQALNLAVEIALFRQLSTFYDDRRVKQECPVDPVYDYARQENWSSLQMIWPAANSSAQLSADSPSQSGDESSTQMSEESSAQMSEESSAQMSEESSAHPSTKIGYFRKLHEPGKTIDLVVDQPAGQCLYNVMFYKRQPFRWKDTIISMTKQPGANFLGATIVTRKTSDNQTVGNGEKIYYDKEPALPILYLFGQEEYEWRKEELMDEQLEHDTMTGFDGAE